MPQLMITPAACRAARALLGWTQVQLAEKSRVARNTVIYYEAGKAEPIYNTLSAIQKALERGGVRFVMVDEGGVAVSVKTT